jgi:catechol 2,3-dioxygenase-like lactoylglutathione lyase family enzyme
VKINLTNVFVDDQREALRFYTEVLGFSKKADTQVGEYSWLTVVSAEDPDGPQLLLEPSEHPAVKPFRDALLDDGIPFAMFAVEDVQAEYERLRGLGVRFTQPPVDMGGAITAVFDDTCGNLIAIGQLTGPPA